MHVVVAPDSFGGTLSARGAADAIAEGWTRARPRDTIRVLPLSDGGEGLLDVVATGADTWLTVEVAGPLGHPREAALLLRGDGSAVIESAQACGLALVDPVHRNPLHTTTFGVGELLEAARAAGATRLLVGLGGSATVDGGAGALTGLGFRLTVADGSGLKVGATDLARVASADRGWSADWSGVEVVLLADVRTALGEAAAVFGPQKGATAEDLATLEAGLRRWADVAERDLAGGQRLRDVPGSGAAGGLGFGLAAGLGAGFVPGASTVATEVGLPEALRTADLVVTGEGRLDRTSAAGKVVGTVQASAEQRGVAVLAVVGQVGEAGIAGLADVEAAAPDGPQDPEAEVVVAAERLARRVG